MFSHSTAQIVILVYAALLAVGGIFGYLKARSRPSLIAGIGSAVVALGALGIAQWLPSFGLFLGAALAAALCIFFNFRYAKSAPRKFMPSGMLALVSLVVMGHLIIAAVR